MASFKELGLSDDILSAVERMGYTTPTPVQEQAIPLVLEGRDIIAAAQTGTGKTAAFTLPAMDKLPHAQKGAGPFMLVVTPTRELAQQIGEVAEQVALTTHHRITTVVGGLSYRPQIAKLRRGTDILIATPGRLIDLMDQQAANLSGVQVLVLDEADRMCDMGFLPSVKKIVADTPSTRQTLLFSATIDKSIKDIVGSMLRDPATVEIARKGDVAQTVDQYLIRTPQSVKPDLIKAVLDEKGADRVIVFARTRSRADSTCRRLRKAGYAVEAIHSDRSQNQRKRALEKFAAGAVNIITATDVLARGIDVDEVDYVINYDVPDQAEDYIHRIGRTGRAGQRGFAVTFVTPDNKAELRAIEKLVKTEIPEMQLECFDMAEATAASAEKSISAQSRRDPEVNRVKRELANKARKRADEAAERAAENETARESANGDKRRKKRSGAPGGERRAAQSRQTKKSSSKQSSTTSVRRSKKKPAQANDKTARKQVESAGSSTARNASKRTEGKRDFKRGGAQGGDRRQGRAESKRDFKRGGKPSGDRQQGRTTTPKAGRASSSKAARSGSDFRPGRSHRAEVERSRNRRRTKQR